MERVYAGWLTKSPPEKKMLKLFRSQQWRRRYFVLYAPPASMTLTARENMAELCYYDNERLNHRKGYIDLTCCEEVVQEVGLSYYQFVFCMRTKHNGRDRTYYLSADSQDEMNQWVACLCGVLHLDDARPAFVAEPSPSPAVINNRSFDSEERYTSEPRRNASVPQTKQVQVAQHAIVAPVTSMPIQINSPQTAATAHQKPATVPEQEAETYILLDECYSGPPVSNCSSGDQMARPPKQPVVQSTVSQPNAEYHNLSNSSQEVTDSLNDSTNSDLAYQLPKLSTGASPSNNEVFLGPATGSSYLPPSHKTVTRQISEADGGIWECHSVVGQSSQSVQPQSPPPKLYARDNHSVSSSIQRTSHSSPANRVSSGYDDYDFPPTFPSAVPLQPPPPRPHMVGGKMHRYVNAAPAVVQPTLSSGGDGSTLGSPDNRNRCSLGETRDPGRIVPCPVLDKESKNGLQPEVIQEPFYTARTRSFKRRETRSTEPLPLPTKKSGVPELSDSDSDTESADETFGVGRKTSNTSSASSQAIEQRQTVQYVDLDLQQSPEVKFSVPDRSPALNRSSASETDYGEIDWLKTNALISTKKQLENKRKSEKSVDG